MKKYILKSFILFCSILYVSCDSSTIIEIKLTNPRIAENKFNNSIYISDANHIFADSNSIFISDSKNSRVIEFNSRLEFLSMFGKYGNGPGELTGSSFIQKHKDLIYVADKNEPKIAVYSETGNFIEDIKLKYPPFGNFCVLDNGNIVYNYPVNDKPLLIVDKNGDVVKKFGSKLNNFIQNNSKLYEQYVFIFKNQLISLNINEPFLNIYSLTNYSLINKFDLRDNIYFKSRYKFMKDELIEKTDYYKNKNFIFIKEAILYDNKLYFSYLKNINKDLFCNNILVFDLIKNRVTHHFSFEYLSGVNLDYITGFNIIRNKFIIYDYGNEKFISYDFK